MKLEIHIDKRRCQGRAVCYSCAARTFRLEAGKAALRPAPWDDLDAILDAARFCPTRAIGVIDADSGRSLYPP